MLSRALPFPRRLPALALLALTVTAAWAADLRKGAIDPKEAGPDFEIQGEYATRGEDDDLKLGAQLIALGDGKFQCVYLPGGLPGAGWDGKTRIRLDGRTVGELTEFGMEGNGWSGRHGGDRLYGKTDKGAEFVLRRVVRKSPAEGMKPPAGATVLFDGTNGDAWVNPRITPEGWLQEGVQTKKSYKNVTLHVEFLLSFMPYARGQARANSGVFLDGRYEVQVLDSFGLDGKNNECGGLYSQRAPDVNMCFPPLSWQTYDIDFQAPEFNAAGEKTKNAVITVRHNGVVVHDRQEILGHTAGGKEGPENGPIQLMNHGNPIRFRNVWVVER